MAVSKEATKGHAVESTKGRGGCVIGNDLTLSNRPGLGVAEPRIADTLNYRTGSGSDLADSKESTKGQVVESTRVMRWWHY